MQTTASGGIGIITNDANGQMVELSVLKQLSRMKKIEIRKPFLEMVENFVMPLGFEKQKTNDGYEYRKKTETGFISVIPYINQYGKLFFISLAFELIMNDVSKVLSYINNISDEFKEAYPTLSFGINSLIKSDDNRIKVETTEELYIALKILKGVLEKEAMIFFDTFKTVADLDNEMNRENRPKDLYTSDREIIGLISAVLNKNPQSKYWEDYYREKLINVNQYVRNQYEKLVVYLKGNYPEILS